MSLIWPIGKLVPHTHSWRLLTSKDDYGRGGSRHWGNYSGVDREECRLCGELQYVPYEVTRKREEEEAARNIRNITPERLEYWRRYSKTSEGPIMIGDGGSVSMLEYGTPSNGGAQVLERGNNKMFGPKYIFRKGKLVTAAELRGDPPANPIGQAHQDASNAAMRGAGGWEPIE